MEKKIVVTSIFACVAGSLGIGILIGYFIGDLSSKVEEDVPYSTSEEMRDINHHLQTYINADNINKYLEALTRTPHLAGTPDSLRVATDELLDFYKELGAFQSVSLVPYKVMLSYPQIDPMSRQYKRSKIELDVDGQKWFTEGREKDERPGDGVVPPYNAFSPSGEYKGTEIVYVNYGRFEDFTFLANHSQSPIFFRDKFVICRYGKIARGNKVKHAEQFGAKGVILYGDPSDYGPPQSTMSYNMRYPSSNMRQSYQTEYLDSGSVQSGNILVVKGDPLTQGYPAIESAFRIGEQDAELPKIPSIPITGDEAERIMKSDVMKNSATQVKHLPLDWVGSLKDGNYNPLSAVKGGITMTINNELRNVTVYNVVAMMEGTIEPDRYVMVGNHHDAWAYGGVDPSSGTAIVKEMGRSFAKLYQSGWRPKRTLMFIHWGGEEFGLIGSTEFAEQFAQNLGYRGVIYINIDAPVKGNYSFTAKSSFGLNQILYDVTKEVKNPDFENDGPKTLYEKWQKVSKKTSMMSRAYNPVWSRMNNDNPTVALLGSGSDFAPLAYSVGIQCIDLQYNAEPGKFNVPYPRYHTRSDNYDLVRMLIDPHFRAHQAIGRVGALLVASFSNSALLPINPKEFGDSISEYFDKFRNIHISELESSNERRTMFTFLHDAKKKFLEETNRFHNMIEKFKNEINSKLDQKDSDKSTFNNLDILKIRRINDQLMYLERSFLLSEGLWNRHLTRNALSAPSLHDAYSGSIFPGLTDAIWLERNGDLLRKAAQTDDVKEIEPKKQIDQVAKQISILSFVFDSATSSIKNTVDFIEM